MWLAFLGAVVFAAAFLFLPRRVALALPLSSSSTGSSPREPIWYGPYPYGVEQAGAGALFQGIAAQARLDRPRRAGRPDVAVLWTSRSDRFTVNQNEFFNRSVGQVYYTVRPDAAAASAELPVAVDRRTGAVRLADGSAVRPGTCSTDGSVEPDAIPVARDPPLGMTSGRSTGRSSSRRRASPASTRTTRGRARA